MLNFMIILALGFGTQASEPCSGKYCNIVAGKTTRIKKHGKCYDIKSSRDTDLNVPIDTTDKLQVFLDAELAKISKTACPQP